MIPINYSAEKLNSIKVNKLIIMELDEKIILETSK